MNLSCERNDIKKERNDCPYQRRRTHFFLHCVNFFGKTSVEINDNKKNKKENNYNIGLTHFRLCVRYTTHGLLVST